jgi:hypothetical protein
MALQNVAGVLTGRGLMDCLQYYDSCLFSLLLTLSMYQIGENEVFYVQIDLHFYPHV